MLLKKATKHGGSPSGSGNYNAYLISAGLTDPFHG
jgi:hypothetical protein